MKIFATGDTHWNFERFRPEYFPEAKSSPRKMWYSSWETSAACGSGINGMTRPWTPCCKPNCRRRNCTLRLAGPSVLARRRARR